MIHPICGLKLPSHLFIVEAAFVKKIKKKKIKEISKKNHKEKGWFFFIVITGSSSHGKSYFSPIIIFFFSEVKWNEILLLFRLHYYYGKIDLYGITRVKETSVTL